MPVLLQWLTLEHHIPTRGWNISAHNITAYVKDRSGHEHTTSNMGLADGAAWTAGSVQIQPHQPWFVMRARVEMQHMNYMARLL